MKKTGYRLWAMGNRKIFSCFTYCLMPIAYCLLLTGCASPKGPIVLAPLPTKSPGYAVLERKIVFSNDEVKIGISHLALPEVQNMLASKNANDRLTKILTGRQYLAFLLDIENSSKEKVIYNPVLTTLFDSDFGVHKPLDYTDMYMLIGDSPNPEAAINNIKDIVYDLAVTVGPNQRASRLLIFSGIEQESGEVAINMKEIYVGTKTIAVSFGFKISP